MTLKYARLGEYDLITEKDCVQIHNGHLDCAPPPVDYDISEIIPHPQYDPKNPSKYHDLALLRLTENVRYTNFIRPICMPTEDFEKGFISGYRHVVCGWGKTDMCKSAIYCNKSLISIKRISVKAKYGNKLVSSPIKLKVSLPYADKVNCEEKYAAGNIKLSPSQICAGGMKAKDSCSGK